MDFKENTRLEESARDSSGSSRSCASINAFDEQFKALSDDDLRAKTAAWNAELSAIEDPDALAQRLEEILPEAFAVVKNAARRLTERQETFSVCDQPMTWNMVHFDVQLIGGIVPAPRPDRGNGDGRRQDARRDAAALSQCAHRPRRALVTVNDYLARRDARDGWASFTVSSA